MCIGLTAAVREPMNATILPTLSPGPGTSLQADLQPSALRTMRAFCLVLISINMPAGPASYQATMITWIARGLLISAGFVAGWFIARDVPQFGLVKGAVVLILFVVIVAVVGLWPAQWNVSTSQLAKSG